MHRKRLSAALAIAGVIALAPSVLAGNPFSRSTTTEDGNHTWDSDQIDIENVSETGAGVYVAVLDTGLVANWKDYFPDARVAQELGKGFYQAVSFKTTDDPCNVDPVIERNLREVSFIGSRSSSHGTHVTSTIIGYNYYSNTDAAQGFALPPIQVRGIAPNATIIPVKVLADYQIPSLPKCDDPNVTTGLVNFGTNTMVAAGIDYVTSLAEGQLAGKRIVINMSLGDSEPSDEIEDAIDRAIDAGVIVVASAGNDGICRPSLPAALPDVISVAALGPNGPARFSNYGPWVRACAPGVDIVSRFFTKFDGNEVALPGGTDPDKFASWARWSGTSFAGPIVVAALARELQLGLTTLEAVERVIDAPGLLRIPDFGTVVNLQ